MNTCWSGNNVAALAQSVVHIVSARKPEHSATLVCDDNQLTAHWDNPFIHNTTKLRSKQSRAVYHYVSEF
jgi:hypothetical protein